MAQKQDIDVNIQF